MKIPVGILCCWHWHIPYVWTSFCSTRGGRRRPSTQSPPQWLSTESKSECEKCVPSLKGPLPSRVYQNYHMTENVFFRQYDNFWKNMTFVSFHSGHVAIFEITDSVQSRIFLYFCLCVTSISSQLFSSSIIWLYWL